MWYTNTLTVQQNPNFYEQLDSSGKVNSEPIDTTVYTFDGNLGCVFSSTERSKPQVGDTRLIYGVEFSPCRIERIGLWKYRTCWTSKQLDSYEAIAQFYYDNLLCQVPSSTCITDLKQGITNALSSRIQANP